MQTSELNFEIMHRKGYESADSTRHEVFSIDFLINGNSLIDSICRDWKYRPDVAGCFAKGHETLNSHSRKQLLLLEAPETETGRSILYGCPECFDIGCGAYTCRIRNENECYIWSDFAYENGYEEPGLIQDIGPFVFDAEKYENIIETVSKM